MIICCFFPFPIKSSKKAFDVCKSLGTLWQMFNQIWNFFWVKGRKIVCLFSLEIKCLIDSFRCLLPSSDDINFLLIESLWKNNKILTRKLFPKTISRDFFAAFQQKSFNDIISLSSSLGMIKFPFVLSGGEIFWFWMKLNNNNSQTKIQEEKRNESLQFTTLKTS